MCPAPESEALLFYIALPWFIGIAPRALFPSPRRSAAMQLRRCAPLLIARTNQTRKKPGLIIPAQSPSSARGLGGGSSFPYPFKRAAALGGGAASEKNKTNTLQA